MASQIVINLFDRPNGLRKERTHAAKDMKFARKPSTGQRRSRGKATGGKRGKVVPEGGSEEFCFN
jgi:hypothetical protein